MNTYPPGYAAFYKGLTNRELIVELQNALDQDYARIREWASNAWERRFTGKDPSDACVSVRISSGVAVTSRRARRGVRGTAERLQSCVWNFDALHAMDDAA